MRRFYAPPENFNDANLVTLGLEETRHLRDVLRLSIGDYVQVFNGEGDEFLCNIKDISKRDTTLKIIEKTAPAAPESDLDLTLAVALLKGEKFELVVQKAVELGVARVVPLNTKRADVKMKDADRKLERWQKIALEAAKQSGRARLMKIEPPTDFEKFIKNSASQRSGGENLVLFAERGGESFSSLRQSKKITALIGSEGGWEASEIESARESGFQIVTLAGRILRAETATIAVAAVLQNVFGDLR